MLLIFTFFSNLLACSPLGSGEVRSTPDHLAIVKDQSASITGGLRKLRKAKRVHGKSTTEHTVSLNLSSHVPCVSTND